VRESRLGLAMIRVVLPYHLRNLAKIEGVLSLDLDGPVTQRTVVDAIEAKYPMLKGTIRDHSTKLRRPFIRFYACQQDLSNEPLDAPLPDAVIEGQEEYMVVGAMAGG
jgi:sulfur-carrier protein